MHDTDVPIANTAVFASFDEHSTKFNDSRIHSVDGKKTSCFEVGCPYWVRIAPGDHAFKVRYTSNHRWNLNGSSYTYADLPIEIKDMKPRHVYVARYHEADRKIKFRIEDLGENPSFGITLGLDGLNKDFYPVSFQ